MFPVRNVEFKNHLKRKFYSYCLEKKLAVISKRWLHFFKEKNYVLLIKGEMYKNHFAIFYIVHHAKF